MDTSKYLQVIENIREELMASKLSDNIGLHAGTSGIALFLAYYDRIIRKSNELSPRVMEIMEHNIKQIEAGNWQHSICNGISGFGWLCEHLRKLGMLSREEIEFLDDLDVFLYRQMMVDIKRGYYDFLHGSLGVGAYLTTRFERERTQEYMFDLLQELENSSILCENGAIKWTSVLKKETGEKGYNICLSHGISSIAAFFIKLYKIDFEMERVRKLLSCTIMYILDQIVYREGSISYFPSYSKESSSDNYYYSRLGWCYGDLGIAHILWQASIVLNNKEWEKIALQVLLHNVNRRDLKINGIRDAGICHGSAGVAYIFWNIYLHTRIGEFREVTEYWLDVTMQMAKYKDSLAGYKSWRTEESGGPEKSDNLIDGIAGIGIVLLSVMSKNESSWDESFMLSLTNI